MECDFTWPAFRRAKLSDVRDALAFGLTFVLPRLGSCLRQRLERLTRILCTILRLVILHQQAGLYVCAVLHLMVNLLLRSTHLVPLYVDSARHPLRLMALATLLSIKGISFG